MINRTVLVAYLNQERDKGNLEGIRKLLRDIGAPEEYINKGLSKWLTRENFGLAAIQALIIKDQGVYRAGLERVQKDFHIIYKP